MMAFFQPALRTTCLAFLPIARLRGLRRRCAATLITRTDSTVTSNTCSTACLICILFARLSTSNAYCFCGSSPSRVTFSVMRGRFKISYRCIASPLPQNALNDLQRPHRHHHGFVTEQVADIEILCAQVLDVG